MSYEPTDYETEVLRATAGRTVPSVIAGAALWHTVTYLQRKGYLHQVDGAFKLTPLGEEHVQSYEAAQKIAEEAELAAWPSGFYLMLFGLGVIFISVLLTYLTSSR